MKDIGKLIEDVLPYVNEGEITQRYGKIGQGKTYGATVDVIDELKRGHIVYTNWDIDWNGFDERESFIHILGSLLFFRNKFRKFPASNLRKIEVDENFIKNFSQLTNCSVYLDEGHVVFDSYEMAKMSMDKRVAVLHTRHFDRSIHIISQRPTAIHRMLRANVNRFYRYDKLISKPFILFRRVEYQEMEDENVVEENPESVKLYLGQKKIFNAYNSKYLRGNAQNQTPNAMIFKVNIFHRIARLIALIFAPLFRAERKVSLSDSTLKNTKNENPKPKNRTSKVKTLSPI